MQPKARATPPPNRASPDAHNMKMVLNTSTSPRHRVGGYGRGGDPVSGGICFVPEDLS